MCAFELLDIMIFEVWLGGMMELLVRWDEVVFRVHVCGSWGGG